MSATISSKRGVGGCASFLRFPGTTANGGDRAMTLLMRALHRLSQALLVASCGLIAVMMLHIVADILAKFVLGRPIVGTLEAVTYYYMVAAVFLGLPIVTRERGHIVVELFTQRLSRRRLALLDGLVFLAVAAFVGLMAYAAAIQAIQQTIDGETTWADAFRVPIWPGRWFVVVGAGLTTAHFLVQGIGELLYAVSGRRPGGTDAPSPALTDQGSAAS